MGPLKLFWERNRQSITESAAMCLYCSKGEYGGKKIVRDTVHDVRLRQEPFQEWASASYITYGEALHSSLILHHSRPGENGRQRQSLRKGGKNQAV